MELLNDDAQLLEVGIHESLPWESFSKAFASNKTWDENSKANETGTDGVDEDGFFTEIFVKTSKTWVERFTLQSYLLAEGEVCLLCEPGYAGGDGEEEGGGSEGGVDGDKGGAERRGGALAAKQKKETEESNYEL